MFDEEMLSHKAEEEAAMEAEMAMAKVGYYIIHHLYINKLLNEWCLISLPSPISPDLMMLLYCNVSPQQREEEELREYRKLPVEQGGCQFKAKPVQQNVHPLAPAPSNKKLTVPKTPNLLTSKRFHHRPQGPA